MAEQAKIPTRTIIVHGTIQKQTAHAVIDNLPMDGTMQIAIGPVKKEAKESQRAAMWSGLLRDMENQAWVAGRRHDAKTWHELFKADFLPEEDDPELDELVKDPANYRKWAFTPMDRPVLVGSTKDLTRKGMARYMQQIEAFGASLGVHFTAPPSQEK